MEQNPLRQRPREVLRQVHHFSRAFTAKSNPFLGLAVLPLTTGISLVVYIVSRVSLLLATVVVAIFAFAMAWTIWRHVPLVLRPMLKQRARIAAWVGVIATIAYDLSRFILIQLFHLMYWPFGVYQIFGQLLIGESAPKLLIASVGWLFHFTNGIGFALGFVFLSRRPNVVKGLLWAGVLELFMVTLYPGWLGLKALNDFLSVSIFGHAAYGSVLGAITKKKLENNLTLPQDREIRRSPNASVF